MFIISTIKCNDEHNEITLVRVNRIGMTCFSYIYMSCGLNAKHVIYMSCGLNEKHVIRIDAKNNNLCRILYVIQLSDIVYNVTFPA